MDCPHCSKTINDVISKSRFDQIYTERKTARAEVEKLRSELEAATETATNGAKLEQRIAELQTQIANANDQFATYRDLSSAGFTDESVINGIKQQYASLTKEDRPQLAEWIAALKADPSAAPALLRPHFEQLRSPQQTTAPPQTAPTPQNETIQAQAEPPRANVAARPYAAAPSKLTPEQIMTMDRDQFRKFGESLGWSSGKPANGV